MGVGNWIDFFSRGEDRVWGPRVLTCHRNLEALVENDHNDERFTGENAERVGAACGLVGHISGMRDPTAVVLSTPL